MHGYPRNVNPLGQVLFIVGLTIAIILVYTSYNPITSIGETKEDYCRGIGLIAEETVKLKRKGVPLYLIVERGNSGLKNVPVQFAMLMNSAYNLENDDPYRVKKIFEDSCLKYR